MSRADTEARVLLDECGITAPAIDVNLIAKHLGVTVVNAKLDGDVSGMLIRDAGTRTVGLNSAQSPRRKRFTLAHEIGHLRLHRGRPLIVDSPVRVNLRDSTSARATDREEMEANRFAASLLMPEHLVVDAVYAEGADNPVALRESLARLFDVSSEAMGYRLVNLGLTT